MELYRCVFKCFSRVIISEPVFYAETLDHAKRDIEAFFKVFTAAYIPPASFLFEWQPDDPRIFEVCLFLESEMVHPTVCYRGYVLLEADYQASRSKTEMQMMTPEMKALQTLETPSV